MYTVDKLRDTQREERGEMRAERCAYLRRGKGVQRENEGGVTAAYRDREQRERGPVFPLCIVPPLVFVAHD